MKIYIDVGHGGKDPGAVGQHPGYTIIERDLNLIMAEILRNSLQQYQGVETLMSRLTNDLSAPYDVGDINGSAYRCNLWQTYNDKPVDLMVSVHNNASGSGLARGYDVIHSVTHPPALANAIATEWDAIGRPRHAIFSKPGAGGTDWYGIIRETVRPNTQAIILEGVFIDNREEVSGWIWDEEKGVYRMDKIKAVIAAVVRGIVNHFKLQPRPAPEPEPKPKPAPVWQGIQSISAIYDRTEGTMAVIEITINGHTIMVDVPLSEEE